MTLLLFYILKNKAKRDGKRVSIALIRQSNLDFSATFNSNSVCIQKKIIYRGSNPGPPFDALSDVSRFRLSHLVTLPPHPTPFVHMGSRAIIFGHKLRDLALSHESWCMVCLLKHAHTHTCTHSHTHTRTHSHTHTRTHSHTHTRTHSHTHTRTHSHTHTLTHSLTHTHTHSHCHSHTNMLLQHCVLMGVCQRERQRERGMKRNRDQSISTESISMYIQM